MHMLHDIANMLCSYGIGVALVKSPSFIRLVSILSLLLLGCLGAANAQSNSESSSYRCYCPVVDGGFYETSNTDLSQRPCAIGRPWRSSQQATENGSLWRCTAASPSVPRFAVSKSFQYSNGVFSRQESGWVEQRTNGPMSYFQEVRRTPSFVELFDESRRMWVRLLIDQALWTRNYPNGPWTRWPGSTGVWR